LESFAQSVSLSHGYNSSYSEGWKIDPDGNKQIQTQRVNYGFSPLVGVNFTFNKLWGGDMSASFKYGTRSGYSLGASTENITETFSKDINLTASYRKSGFEIPLFGVALKNDIEMSLSYTSATNSTVIYEMGEDFKEKGEPQDGTIRTTIEPRIRYVMSSRVTLSFFYKRTTVEPKGASRVPPTTTNEVGLDVSISIQ
jgi:cell surface protein SprA